MELEFRVFIQKKKNITLDNLFGKIHFILYHLVQGIDFA